jgi:hypothetical protein
MASTKAASEGFQGGIRSRAIRGALISTKGIGLRGPVHLVRSSRISVEVVFRRLMVGDCVGECVKHSKLMVASFESGRLHHQ